MALDSPKVKEVTRLISIARLKPSRALHLRPIDVVVYNESYGGLKPTGYLFSGGASRLDAFSVYPCRTSLPDDATGVTAGTQEVRCSRSSRTREQPSQVSTPAVDRRPNCLTTF